MPWDKAAYQRRYHQKNKKRHNEASRRQYLKVKDTKEFKEHRSEYKRRWYQAKKEHVSKWGRDYYQKHKKRIKKRHSKYQKSHPEGGAARAHNYRARKRSAPGSHTAQDIFDLWEKQHHKCAVPHCEHPISGGGVNHYHTDHIWPLNSPKACNCKRCLQLLCTFHNTSKDDMEPNAWGKQFGLKYKQHKPLQRLTK